MRFYYTGAVDFLDTQKDPFLSLGGYISSTVVPNNKLNNALSSISSYSKQKGESEIILIALKNELGIDISNISLWIDSEVNSSINLEIAVVKPTLVPCADGDKYKFEKISNSESEPYYVDEFSSIEGKDNALNISEIKKDSYLGFWLKKTIKANSVIDCPPLSDIDDEQKIKETVTLNLEWI